jgi:membrane-bound serine protease (ClpP class)
MSAPDRPGPRRTLPRVFALLALALATASLVSGSNLAAAQDEERRSFVTVIEASGLLDPVLVDFVDTQIARAERQGAVALVVQLNSEGSVVSDRRLHALAERIRTARVPVAVWVGPSGSRALGGATHLVAASETSAVSPRSSIEVTATLASTRGVDARELGTTHIGDRIDGERAAELELVDSAAPVLGDFVVDLDGVETEVVQEDGRTARRPLTTVRFAELPLTGQLLHTVASPAVAYLLFVVALGLLIFELFTAGVGIAGMVGAACLVLAGYGLTALPTQPIGVALLVFAAFGYAIDVQTGVPRVWTGIATVSFVLGSLLLYDGVSVSWITLAVAIIGMTLAMLAGMPAMVRTRFSTPTIGREWMVGELGDARVDLAPEGVVTVQDAPWRARTNRATPIKAGDRVRVVAIEGLVLEVEPEQGGARDYRDRSGRSE